VLFVCALGVVRLLFQCCFGVVRGLCACCPAVARLLLACCLCTCCFSVVWGCLGVVGRYLGVGWMSLACCMGVVSVCSCAVCGVVSVLFRCN